MATIYGHVDEKYFCQHVLLKNITSFWYYTKILWLKIFFWSHQILLSYSPKQHLRKQQQAKHESLYEKDTNPEDTYGDEISKLIKLCTWT